MMRISTAPQCYAWLFQTHSYNTRSNFQDSTMVLHISIQFNHPMTLTAVDSALLSSLFGSAATATSPPFVSLDVPDPSKPTFGAIPSPFVSLSSQIFSEAGVEASLQAHASSGSHIPAGPIIAGVVGFVVIVLTIILLAYTWRRKKRKTHLYDDDARPMHTRASQRRYSSEHNPRGVGTAVDDGGHFHTAASQVGWGRPVTHSNRPAHAAHVTPFDLHDNSNQPRFWSISKGRIEGALYGVTTPSPSFPHEQEAAAHDAAVEPRFNSVLPQSCMVQNQRAPSGEWSGETMTQPTNPTFTPGGNHRGGMHLNDQISTPVDSLPPLYTSL
ncbi:hypothetical protein D9619_005056 [Psilocybe cf. subviscida]|uniref:Uncharacterized protein n=1 Tax=Psilocybe cf. subviscida TaxID=2480587 RepID=A0A8H5F7S0_9AGAR|nr:hypothetical protein D9619_005056 [Psilocybe cf. subviscida]